LWPNSEVAEVGVGLPGQDAQQRGLSGAVEPQDQQPLAAAEVERHVLEHRRAAVALAELLGAHHRPARGRRIGEASRDLASPIGGVRPCRPRAGDALLDAVGLDALVALAPKRSTNVCSRSISLALLLGLLGQARSSSARA
jgi:hypothetical protein